MVLAIPEIIGVIVAALQSFAEARAGTFRNVKEDESLGMRYDHIDPPKAAPLDLLYALQKFDRQPMFSLGPASVPQVVECISI
jgi:hypothetical protein